MMKQTEKWSSIAGLPVGYQISNFGNVRINYGDHYEPGRLSKNSNFVAFCALGKQLAVHRLVAEAFVEKPEGADESKLCIRHIDKDATNNRADNLVWVAKGNKNFSLTFSRGVVETTTNTLFNSISCAAVYFGIPEVFLRTLINEDKQACGYKFRTATSEDIELAAKKVAISTTVVFREMEKMTEFDIKHIQTFMEDYSK